LSPPAPDGAGGTDNRERSAQPALFMARGRKRIRREQTASGRPSVFFIAALTAGILFLMWFFFQELKHPANEQAKPKPAVMLRLL